MSDLLWKRFYTGNPPAENAVLVAPNPDATRQLKQIVLVNSSSGSAEVTLFAPPSGQVAGADNVLVPTMALPPKSITPISFACFTLEPNDSVVGRQTTTNAVAVHIHGVEV